MPMFARGGGIVLTVADSLNTAESDWSRITADVFVPSADGVSRRVLYEDDGESVDYLAGKFRLTELSLERKGRGLKLSLAPSAEHNWVVRFHLPAGERVDGVTLNGSALAQEKVRVLQPGARDLDVIFTGAGSAPPPKGGALVEVETGTMSAGARVDFTVHFSPR